MAGTPDATFYTIADARFFVGAVALLNSLRLVGHCEELVVLDGGLSSEQRLLLEPHATLTRIDRSFAGTLLKPYPHLLGAAGTLALIDSDIVVTASLDPVIARAAEGKICAYPDDPRARDRRFEEWRRIFDLSEPLRRQKYVNAGFVAFSTMHWPGLLSRWWQACERIPSERVFTGDAANPLENGDQDALNALLMSELPADALAELPPESILPIDLRKTRLMDPRRLTCVLDERPARIVHYTGSPKPWEAGAWMRARNDAYVQLLRRVLFGSDVCLRLQPSDVPLWLRPTAAGRYLLRLLSPVNTTTRRIAGRLPPESQRRLRRLRSRPRSRLREKTRS
jgi:hypothetical protein